MDYESEQAMELEALEAIFADQLEEFEGNTPEGWSRHGKTWAITILPSAGAPCVLYKYVTYDVCLPCALISNCQPPPLPRAGTCCAAVATAVAAAVAAMVVHKEWQQHQQKQYLLP